MRCAVRRIALHGPQVFGPRRPSHPFGCRRRLHSAVQAAAGAQSAARRCPVRPSTLCARARARLCACGLCTEGGARDHYVRPAFAPFAFPPPFRPPVWLGFAPHCCGRLGATVNNEGHSAPLHWAAANGHAEVPLCAPSQANAKPSQADLLANPRASFCGSPGADVAQSRRRCVAVPAQCGLNWGLAWSTGPTCRRGDEAAVRAAASGLPTGAQTLLGAQVCALLLEHGASANERALNWAPDPTEPCEVSLRPCAPHCARMPPSHSLSLLAPPPYLPNRRRAHTTAAPQVLSGGAPAARPRRTDGYPRAAERCPAVRWQGADGKWCGGRALMAKQSSGSSSRARAPRRCTMPPQAGTFGRAAHCCASLQQPSAALARLTHICAGLGSPRPHRR
jgi:hypothetical protein